MRTLVLNSTNVIADGNNNTLKYKFPVPVTLKNKEIAISSIELYYSWFNINASLYNNNKFSYVWFNGTTYNVTIPDGYYSADDLGAYFSYVCDVNGHYLNSSTGTRNYFFNITENPTYYAIQFQFTALSAAIAASNNWTLPSGATWTIPATPQTIQVNILPTSTSSFYSIVGFAPATYPSVTTSSINVNSTICPQEKPVNTINVHLSCVNNPYCVPCDVIYSFAPNAVFGETIHPPIYNFAWNDITDAQYSDFTLRFTDQNFNPIRIIDNQISINLLIRDKPMGGM